MVSSDSELRFGEVIYYYSLIKEMLLEHGIFAAFHSNYVNKSDLGLSSSKINRNYSVIWGLLLQRCPAPIDHERLFIISGSSGSREKQTNRHGEAVKSPQ